MGRKGEESTRGVGVREREVVSSDGERGKGREGGGRFFFFKQKTAYEIGL